MSERILKHFKKTVGDYDTVADKVVMKNDELHDVLISALPFKSSDIFTVLDLGCGTGHGAKLVLEKFKNAKVIGIDFSDRMIELAKVHLQSFSSRFTALEQDFTRLLYREQVDAVISAVAIHNVEHTQKRDLFKHIQNILVPGGVFINADFIEGETPQLNVEYQKIYEHFLKENLSGEELDVWKQHAFQDDKPMKISKQFELLKELEFDNQELLWQFNNEAVYRAKK